MVLSPLKHAQPKKSIQMVTEPLLRNLSAAVRNPNPAATNADGNLEMSPMFSGEDFSVNLLYSNDHSDGL